VRRRIGWTVVALAMALTGCATTGGAAGDSTGLYAFRAAELDGSTLDMREHFGRDVVLLNFWATYCEPCKAEMPVLQGMHERLGERGLKIVSISIDTSETISGVRPFIRRQGYTFSVVVDEDEAISQAYNPAKSAPFTIIIDRDGRVVQRIEGFRPAEAAELERRVEELL